jgi:hypothetical protein
MQARKRSGTEKNRPEAGSPAFLVRIEPSPGGVRHMIPVWAGLPSYGGEIMNEWGLLILLVAGWFILNRYILPRFGVRT